MKRLLVSLLVAMTAAVAASPEEDHRAGEKAYLAGDVTGAIAPLRRAADAGHAPSQALLAEILDRAELNDEALAYYRRAAEQGNAAGELGLGTMYLVGEGVKADWRQALSWFARAAERGHAGAITALAQALMTPPRNEKADEAAVARWVRRAAELDYLPAMEYLAASADAQEARRWAERAAEAKKRQAGAPQQQKKRRL